MATSPATIDVHAIGITPERVGERLTPLTEADPQLSLTVTSEAGVVTVRVRSLQGGTPPAHRHADEGATGVERLLRPYAFGRGTRTIQESLVGLLKEEGRRVVTAESCTGGLVGKLITDVAGSSEVYEGGWVVYANEMKVKQLGVAREVIEANGVVSGPVATAMAQGALANSSADLSVAVTGIAGPDGGTNEKPVGTVWFGVAQKSANTNDIASQSVRLQFQGNRDQVREVAAKTAVQLLRVTLLGVSIETVGGSD